MIRKILFNALIFTGLLVNAQSFTATYDFAATTTVSGTTDPTPSPTVTGITCGSFVAVGTPSTNPNAGGRFSFVGWPTGATTAIDTYSTMTGAINTGEYYEVVLTPQPGYTIALNSITFTAQRSGTGIRNYAVRTSADAFTNNLPASVTTNTNLSVVGSNIFFWNFDSNTSAQNGSTISLFGATSTSSVAFRFYGWNSEGSGGTFSIDNVVFTGTVTGAALPCASPTISAVTGNSAVCSNQALNLGSTLLGDAPFTYTWTGAGSIATPNASTTSIINATSSDYTLTVSNACGTATSVVTATVNPTPSVSVNSATICSGSSATLTASGTSSYVWNTGEVTTSIVVTPTSSPVSFTVIGTDANNCSSSAVAAITVNALPNTALTLSPNLQCVTVNTVTLAGGTPAGGVYSGPGVTGGVFSPSAVGAGTYTVTYSYTDGNNCSAIASDIMTVSACTGIQTLNSDVVSIFPNPSNGLVTVKTPILNTVVNVFDVNGKKVFSQAADSFETQLNLSHLANGVYQMNIVSDNQATNQKIMINK